MKWEEFHNNLFQVPKHSCVSRLFVAEVHLYFTLGGVAGWGGFHFQAAIPKLSELPLSLQLQSPLVNNAVSTQLIHNWEGETPTWFMPHIKGLKYSPVMQETVISTVNLSGVSHSMLPNQCQPYGKQKVGHQKQTNKEESSNIMINRWLCPS